jgi:quercetin 2,3-dioxygenase
MPNRKQWVSIVSPFNLRGESNVRAANRQETDMIDVRPYEGLGGGHHGWLDTRHHFSFADYHDAGRMSWGALRVWNDDEIAPNNGFPPHPHADMEIITYVRQGAITHRDSLGNEGRTEAGDVQVMSAGSGIRHSEYNLEPEVTKIFQIWIVPTERGGAPAWGAKPFPRDGRAGRFVTLASGSGRDPEALRIRADASVLGATIKAGETIEYRIKAGRKAYLVVAAGAADVNGVRLRARDGAAVRDEEMLRVTAVEDAEIVLVDVA